MRNLFEDAEVISAYTRAQAIEDGVLVDATIGDPTVSGEDYRHGPQAVAHAEGRLPRRRQCPAGDHDHVAERGLTACAASRCGGVGGAE